MEEALRARLLATAALAAIVGKKIDWGARPQGDALPGLELNLISAIPTMNLAQPGTWRSDRVQADAWAKTHKAARDIADIIAATPANGGLHGLRETISNIRFRIWVIDRDNERDSDSAGIVHRSRLDLRVWWARLQET